MVNRYAKLFLIFSYFWSSALSLKILSINKGKIRGNQFLYSNTLKVNPFTNIFDSFTKLFNTSTVSTVTTEVIKEENKVIVDPNVLLLQEINNNITIINEVLWKASNRNESDTEKVYESLVQLEKLMRKRNTLDNGITSKETYDNLDGSWRLIFTTGTVKTQKKLGGNRINYFPIKAVQSFNTSNKDISNAIYLGNFPLIKFYGQHQWIDKPRKLEFDFDVIQIFGIKINLPKGGAANIGSKTGLGSDENINLINKNRKPFFNWISANNDFATARGGGGGLALWKRTFEV